MRILHISDLHLRNEKYRAEYKEALANLERQAKELGPDLIINTGDTAHAKLSISPELVDDVAGHFRGMASVAPYWVILGNHDLNLNNKGRTDAISPIVRALKGGTHHEIVLLDDGPGWGPNSSYWWETASDEASKDFWHYDIRGRRDPSKFEIDPKRINIGLYHGSISGCVTDIGFTMEEGEAEVSKFDRMDFVLMGDIHKRQSFRGGRMQYPGSLIQQNYGEELVKGFLLWDIKSKDDFAVDFHPVSAPNRFYTVQVPASLDISEVDVPKGSRVRVLMDAELSPSRRWELEKSLQEKFEPREVITSDISEERKIEAPDIDDLVGSRDELMRDYLTKQGLGTDIIETVMTRFAAYERDLVEDETAHGTTWKLKRLAWDNMMNYGEGNVIDFTKLSGVVGIFGPNSVGKSSIFDVMDEALFDKLAKDVPRNVDLVNDNKDFGHMDVQFESNGRPYSIERKIERLEYGQRKLAETKQWGKTSLEFSSIDENLNGGSRPDTEKAIRAIIGSFEDFALTSMVSQNPIFGLPGGGDIINCRETDRRKILFRFLDLNVFEQVGTAVKDDLKLLMGKLKGLDLDKLQTKLLELTTNLNCIHYFIDLKRVEVQTFDAVISSTKSQLESLDDTDKLYKRKMELMDSISGVAVSLGTFRKQLKTFDDRLDNRIDALAKHIEVKPFFPEVSLDDLAKEMESAQAHHASLNIELSQNKQKLTSGKKSLKTLEGIPCEGKFPTCRFISEASEFLDAREMVEKAAASLVYDVETADLKLSTLKSLGIMHKSTADWLQAKSARELEVSEAQTQQVKCQNEVDRRVERLTALEIEHAGLDEKLKDCPPERLVELKEQLRKHEKLSLLARNEIDTALMEIGAMSGQISSVERDITSLSGLSIEANILEQLIEMCGKSGLAYKILTIALPVINSEIAKILSGVVNFTVFFDEDADDQTVTLYIRYGDYKSRPLSLGGGAEKFIASLAVRSALLNISALPKTDILIIDEGFGKLDPEHLEALHRMFEYLRGAFQTVFVISHVDMMKDIVDHILEITSCDGYAHVELQ